jgi:hypothetical protein
VRQGWYDVQESSVDISLTMMDVCRHGMILLSLVLCSLSSTLEALDSWSLWKVDTESTHVHAVEEGTKTFVEAVQTLVQQLEVHHVGFQIGHSIGEFAKSRFQSFERDGLVGEVVAGCGGGHGGAQTGA